MSVVLFRGMGALALAGSKRATRVRKLWSEGLQEGRRGMHLLYQTLAGVYSKKNGWQAGSNSSLVCNIHGLMVQ